MTYPTQSEAKAALVHQATSNNDRINEMHWNGLWYDMVSVSPPGLKSRPQNKPVERNRNVNVDYIKYFCGDELFLSNFYLIPIRWEGLTYPSVEHALQASMCYDPKDRLFFTIGSVKDARRLGQQIKRHYFWRDIILSVIDELLEIKFRNPKMKQKLLDTGERFIGVGDDWGHDYRDVRLSARLMYLRDCLRTGYNHRYDL